MSKDKDTHATHGTPTHTPAKRTPYTHATDGKVSITASGFSPASVEIAVGGKVTWTNDDTVARTVTFDPLPGGQAAPSGDISPDATHEITFPAAGSFGYSDEHGAGTGTVVVS